MRTARRAGGAVVVALLGAAVSGGCSVEPRVVRYRAPGEKPWLEPVDAAVANGCASAILPARYEVLSVLAAVEQTLERRGYTVRSRRALVDEAELRAELPRNGLLERATADIRRVGRGIDVRLCLRGADDAAAADAFDEVLARLGR